MRNTRAWFLVINDNRAVRFTRDGTLLDPFGFPLDVYTKAVLWTGTHYLVAGVITRVTDDGCPRVRVRLQTITRDGVVSERKELGDEPGDDLPLEMATNGRSIAIVLGRTTVLILDPAGNLLARATIAPPEGKEERPEPVGIAPIRDGYAIAYRYEGVQLVTVTNDGVVLQQYGNGLRLFGATYRNDLTAIDPKEVVADDFRAVSTFSAPNGDLLVVRKPDGFLPPRVLIDVLAPDFTIRRTLEAVIRPNTSVVDLEFVAGIPVLTYLTRMPEEAWRGFFRTMDLPAKQRAVR